MDLVDKEDARDEFSNPLINVLVDHLIDLRAKLLGDLRLLRLHHLPHHGDEVLTALGLGIREVEVVERHVLHNLLLLMHITLGPRHVLLGLAVELGGVGVGPAAALPGAVITPAFKEIRDGQPKMISFMAKRARGRMARFIVEERLDRPEGLKDFSLGGYAYDPALSTDTTWTFTR